MGGMLDLLHRGIFMNRESWPSPVYMQDYLYTQAEKLHTRTSTDGIIYRSPDTLSPHVKVCVRT